MKKVNRYRYKATCEYQNDYQFDLKKQKLDVDIDDTLNSYLIEREEKELARRWGAIKCTMTSLNYEKETSIVHPFKPLV